MRLYKIPCMPQCLQTQPRLLQHNFLPFEGQQLLELTAAFKALMQLPVEPKEPLLVFEVYSSDGACSKWKKFQEHGSAQADAARGRCRGWVPGGTAKSTANCLKRTKVARTKNPRLFPTRRWLLPGPWCTQIAGNALSTSKAQLEWRQS